MGKGGAAAFDTPDRRLDQAGIRPCIWKVYESRSGLIALPHRLGLEDNKPDVIPHLRDEENQKAFIESYDKLLNSLGGNEAVLVMDAGRIQPVPRDPPAALHRAKRSWNRVY